MSAESMGTGTRESTSLVETLRRRIVSEISSGILTPGTRLGGERDLAEAYGVSRSTLRQVLGGLEEAGLVERVAGRGGGTFVGHPKVARDSAEVIGLPASLASQGYAAGTRVLSTRLASPDDETRTALKLRGSDLVAEIQRLRLADGRPLSLDRALFPSSRFQGLLELPLGGSLYSLLEERFDLRIGEAAETIEVVNATDDEAQVLGVDVGFPLVSIERITYDDVGEPFEYSHDLFRSDRVRITMRSPGRGLHAAAVGHEEMVTLTAVDRLASDEGGSP
ncbi:MULTISPECIES: GntR family transcriptional regulator [Gordonia]|uniref:GntR family transcriptional regulator n=1 Tax=Gordonia TaxID=2053 RepID=UPI00326621F6